MEAKRKFWNDQQKQLRAALAKPDTFMEAIDLFFQQHAMVHGSQMVQTDLHSFADEVLTDMSENAIRRIPKNGEHSVAWVIFHIARIEDVVTNRLIAATPQVFKSDDWQARMNSPIHHTANAMPHAEVVSLSNTLDLEALWAYRIAVGRRTCDIVNQLQAADLKRKAEPSGLQQILDDGIVAADAHGIVEYWSRRTIADLLLMPPTRHNFLHLNEALRIKQRRQ